MPWFKIDDSAHSHPKWVKAGNAALGLWLRCGAYSAQHLLEGRVPGDIAKLYGTGPQAAKLVKVGLWHDSTHTCDRCPPVEEGDYVIHDFFEGGRNSTRAQTLANRQAATERKAKSRAKAAGAEIADGFADDSSAKTNRFTRETSANASRNEPQFSGSAAGQGDESQRDATGSVTASHAAAMPNHLPPTEVGAAAGERPQALPDQLAELKQGIAAAGFIGVSWRLRESQWEHARQAMQRVGVPAMVACAINSARLKGTPASASAWIEDWRSLEPTPENPGVAYLPAVVNGPQQLRPVSRQQQETDDWFERSMARAQAKDAAAQQMRETS